MAGPVSGYPAGNNYIYHTQHLSPSPHTAQASSSQNIRPQTGTRIAYIHGRPVETKAINQTGFASAFSTPQTAAIAERRHYAINPRDAARIMGQKARLAQEAHNTMTALSTMDLNHHPVTNSILYQHSKEYMAGVPEAQRRDILEAINDYQGPHGDNYLMNISDMGYESLQQFLQLRSSEYHNDENIDEFIQDFAERYGALTGLDDEQEELDELKDRLENRLAEPAATLHNFLNHGPDISVVPLLKGATGGDNLLTTQLNGEEAVKAFLNGQALNFNTFLSTTTDYRTALEFCGKTIGTALGRPEYVIDLTSHTAESEVLRRDALRDIDNGKMDCGSLLFYFITQNATGVNITAAQEAINPDNENHMNEEDEVLLPPGHYFQPEKIVRNEGGVVLIGKLTNGNLV